MTPLRIITAVYYDVLLYWAVKLDDNIKDVFIPKLGRYRYEKGIKYIFHWCYGLPYRILLFILKSLSVLADSFFMFAISIFFPTLTMYHGTNFDYAGSKIAQSGKWLVGTGNFAGTGLYFAISKKVAKHYATNKNSGILILRITTTFTRNQKTLKKELREMIGKHGNQLSKNLKKPWATLEHWRSSRGGWWEYCIVQPDRTDKLIRTWRIRPVAILKNNIISRIWGGFSLYIKQPQNIVMGTLSWFILIIISYLIYDNLYEIKYLYNKGLNQLKLLTLLK